MIATIPKAVLNAIAERESECDWYSARETARAQLRSADRSEHKRNLRIWYEYVNTGRTNGVLVRRG